MTVTSEQLAAIRERANNATPGPWMWHSHITADGDSWAVLDRTELPLARSNNGWAPDAEFIAHAREDMPALLNRVDALTARLEAVRKLHTLYTDHRELQWCHHCETPWPCLTVQAIEGDT